MDPAKRKAIIDQCLELLYDDMAAAPICMKPLEHRVVNPRIKNLKTIHQSEQSYPYRYAQLWLE